MSSFFRQVCALVLTIFNSCMDWIMGKVVIQKQCRETLGNIKVTDLDFPDGAAILSKSLEAVVGARCIQQPGDAKRPRTRIRGEFYIPR